jgi:RND family efflux transporter MFP subunit
VAAHLARKTRAALAWALGNRHAGWKLLGGTAALLLLLAALVPLPHRLAAPAVLEGQIQRAAVAPFAGYIRSAAARAGDTVKAGQLLATLDDRDLQLERARWEAEFELASRKEREAMAGNDRAVLRQMAAQAAQAQAQLDLAREKLARLEIRAPFDGVVVKGDLSQLLGAPVEAGKVLFELAPLQAWRVILKVDERDIAHVREGQAGELVLTGMPGASYAVSTRQVLSVAQAEEGRNHFRVEATLQGDTARLRPGMEGVAKVDVGQASALWLATHRLTDWLRRTVWEWTP